MSRRPLASELVWPVTRSRLKDTIGPEREGLRVLYLDGSAEPKDRPFYAHWTTHETTERLALPQWSAGISVGIRPIPKADHQRVKALIESEVLPDLGAWVAAATEADEEWRSQTRSRVWVISADDIVPIDKFGTP